MKKLLLFCAIGQSEQFFDFAKKYYNLADKIAFSDHYKYTKNDIKKLIEKAKIKNVYTFRTTQKDETKLVELVKEISGFSFNVLELETKIEDFIENYFLVSPLKKLSIKPSISPFITPSTFDDSKPVLWSLTILYGWKT